MTTFKDKLSPVYHPLLPEQVLEMEIAQERFADCMDCFHCKCSARTTQSIKCCSYHPVLPNYMVGAILADHSPEMAEGRQRILDKINQRIGVTPYGIIPPLTHHQLYQKHVRKSKGEIARSKEIADALQCPFQSEESLCTIWKYRTELCSTYHCASVGGQKGKRFWNVAFQYLTGMEQKLTLLALQEIGYPAKHIRIHRLSPPAVRLDNEKGELNEAVYKNLWRQWEGKELDFFAACYTHIQQMDQAQVAAATGMESSLQVEQLQVRATDILAQQIPDFLQLNTSHPSFEQMVTERKLQLPKGGQLKVTPLQFKFLKAFNGTTPTLQIIKKSYTVQQGIVRLIMPLMKAGVLVRV